MTNAILLGVIIIAGIAELAALALAISVFSNGGSAILMVASLIAMCTPAIALYVGVKMYRARKSVTGPI